MAKREQNSLLAKRYATALYEVAAAKKKQKAVEKDLAILAELLESSSEFVSLTSNPTFSKSQLVAALEALAKKAKMDGVTTDFLKTLAQNKRMALLVHVIAAFQELLYTERGEVLAEITSAKKLVKKEKDAISKALEKRLSQKVVLDEKINEDLIAGFVVKVGSRMLDTSVRGKLEQMHRHLQQS